MKMKRSSSRTCARGTLLFCCAFSIGCGGGVSGNTYVDNGGVVQVEFKSGGKAYVSTGPVSHTCSYTESGKTVTLNCDGDTTRFTVDDDGSLNGPQGGFLGRLNKKK